MLNKSSGNFWDFRGLERKSEEKMPDNEGCPALEGERSVENGLDFEAADGHAINVRIIIYTNYI